MTTNTETKPEAVEPTKPEEQERTNPQGREDLSPTPSKRESSEPSPEGGEITLEQLQAEMKARDETIANLKRGMTELGQTKSRVEQEAMRYRSMLDSALDRQQPQTDPLEELEAQYTQAVWNGEMDQAVQIRKQIRNAERQKYRQEDLSEFLRLTQAASKADHVQRTYGYDIPKLNEAVARAGNDPEVAAKLALMLDGRYDEVMAKQREAQQRAADDAAVLGRLRGSGSAGEVPGSANARGGKRVNDVTFLMLPQSKQDEALAAGYRVYDNRTGEDITDSLK